MPRFLVTICDTNTGEILSELVHAAYETRAILAHTWISKTYKDEYVDAMFFDEQEDICKQALYATLSWAVSCVNLDSVIMSDLNGGDSSVSSQTVE